MNIPFFSFSEMHEASRKGLMEEFGNVLESGWFINGKRLENFESAFAAYCGTSFCAGVANGLDALILSLKALGIGPGDEVIVPSNTYIATWLAVSAVGATLVPVEPDDNTFNLASKNISDSISANTRAIIPVHLFGQPCEMQALMDVANAHNIKVIEDNAQAQGASFAGKKTGSWGHLNATSFYPGKNLGALGDAGGITSNDGLLIGRVKMLRNYGSETKYHNLEKGMNSRLDELQAALLSVKLKFLDQWNNERQKIAALYSEHLQSIIELKLPTIAPDAISVWHQYVIRTDSRDDLQKYLHENGIGTLIHYPVPPHLQPAYAELNFKKGDFPIAEKMAETVLSLPIYPGLTDDQIHSIITVIKRYFAKG